MQPVGVFALRASEAWVCACLRDRASVCPLCASGMAALVPRIGSGVGENRGMTCVRSMHPRFVSRWCLVFIPGLVCTGKDGRNRGG